MQTSVEIERALIGAMVIEESVIAEVSTIVGPADFYLQSAAKVYECILHLHNERKAVDLFTLQHELKALGRDDPSPSEIAKWAEDALPSHAVAHAETVKKFSNARAMTRACQDALAKLSELADEPKQIGEGLASKLLQIGSNQRRQFVSLEQATIEVLKSIERAATDGARDAVPTGLRSIDRKTGGFFRGQLIIIAGRPSMGKTAIAMTILKGAAQRGYTTAIVSCESPTNSLVLRMLSSASGIENRDLRRGALTDRDYPMITYAAGQISHLPIYLYDRERNWEAIKAMLRALKIKQPELSLVAIDYIQLLQLRTREDRWQQMGQISSEAKELALELDLPFVLLSQISRDVEKRQDKRPNMSDLRESGNLEQDADVIGLLYRPHYYKSDELPDEAEINIAKNRDGATGIMELRFNEQTASFSDPPETAQEQESFI
jgi:replicative DNA helicase